MILPLTLLQISRKTPMLSESGCRRFYSILRWDTGCYTLDLADLSLRPEAGDYIMDDIKAKKIPAFLAGEGTIRRLEKYSSKEKSQWLLDTYEIPGNLNLKELYFSILL